jgi:hypothetical protein
VAICRGGETAEHGDDLDHEKTPFAALGIGATPMSCGCLCPAARSRDRPAGKRCYKSRGLLELGEFARAQTLGQIE